MTLHTGAAVPPQHCLQHGMMFRLFVLSWPLLCVVFVTAHSCFMGAFAFGCVYLMKCRLVDNFHVDAQVR